MFDILSQEVIIAFIAASIVLSFVPGPDNIFVMTQSALKGWRVGFLQLLGYVLV